MTQELIASLLVLGAALYAAVRFMPESVRGVVAGYVSRVAREAGLSELAVERINSKLVSAGGCGSCKTCNQCATAVADPAAPVAGESARRVIAILPAKEKRPGSA